MPILTLLKLLPEILSLIKALELAIAKSEQNRKVKDDLNAINEAFKTGDASKLNHLFATSK